MSRAPLTEDGKNFWRVVRILFDDVPNRLRELFKSKFNERVKIAWGDNRTSGEFFIANSDTRRIGQRVIDVIKHGDTAQFDCTALFTCLLFSGSGVLLPTPRRGVRTRPVEDSERVDELREMRHELSRITSASLPHAAFIQKLTSLNVIYAQLQWNPTVMRQWARSPVVTANCVHLKQQLEAERQNLSVIHKRMNSSLPRRVQRSRDHRDDASSERTNVGLPRRVQRSRDHTNDASSYKMAPRDCPTSTPKVKNPVGEEDWTEELDPPGCVFIVDSPGLRACIEKAYGPANVYTFGEMTWPMPDM